MLKLILRLFLLIFVTKSVKSLQCYRTAEGACESITDRKDLSNCLSDNYGKFTCESHHKACIHGYIIDKDGVRIDLRECTSDKSAPKDICEKELFVMVSRGFPESIRKETKCVACEYDLCNENLFNLEPYKHFSRRCYVTDVAACGSRTDKKGLAKCISGRYIEFTCKWPRDKACIKAHVVDKDGVSIDLRGCTSDETAPEYKCEEELIQPIADKLFPLATRKQTVCEACESDFCNENVPLHKHASSVGSYKNVSYYAKLFACFTVAVNAFVPSI